MKVHIGFNQSAYAAKLFMFIEQFYPDLTWLMTAGIEQEFLAVVPHRRSCIAGRYRQGHLQSQRNPVIVKCQKEEKKYEQNGGWRKK